MANFGADLLLAPFRRPDLNQSTDIKAGDYYPVVDSAADIAVISAVNVDVHVFYFCVQCFACTKSL